MHTATLDNIYDVQFSREASVQHPNGGFFGAFEMDSYLAKVVFDDGRQVVVILPKMAAQLPESKWVAKAIKWALMGYEADQNVIGMPGSY